MLLLLFSFVLVYPVEQAAASPAIVFKSRAVAVYRSSTLSGVNYPKYREWGASLTWGSEAQMQNAGSPVKWVRTAYSTNTTRFYERITVTQGDDGKLDAYVWNGTSWLVTNNIGDASATGRAFDIAYEKTKGRAMLVYGPGLISLTLRPDTAGSYQQWSTFGSGTAHWDRTSDQSDATGVQVTGSTTLKETENLQDTSQTGTITSVTAYMRAFSTGAAGGEDARIIWKLGVSEVESADKGISRTAFTDYSDTRTLDPGGGSWDWSDINSLEIGSRAKTLGTGETIQVSEYWIVVTYYYQDLAYRIWDGSSWSSENYLDDTGHTGLVEYYWVELASRPTSGSNEITLVALDGTNTDINAWVWTGTVWGSMTEITTAATATAQQSFSVTYESGGKAWVFYGDGTSVTRRNHFGGAWASWTNSTGVGGTPYWVTAKGDPSSEKVMVVSIDSASDLNIIYGDGDFTLTLNYGSFTEDTAVDTNLYRCADFEWEPTGSNGLIVWGTDAGQIKWKNFNVTTPAWGAGGTPVMGSGTHPWVQLRRNQRNIAGDLKILGGVLEDTQNDLGAIKWDGTTFTVIGAATFTADTGTSATEVFEIEYMPIIPTAATIRVVPASLTTGSPFSVNITVENAFELYGWEFKLNHTRTILTPTSVAVGDFLNKTVGTAYTYGYLKEMSDNQTNFRVWATQSITGDRQGAMGYGKLATISYSLDGPGTSPLDLRDTQLVGYNYTGDKSLYYITHAAVDGSVTSTLPPTPEFPLGAAMEISLIAAIIYIWWIHKKKIKTPTIPK